MRGGININTITTATTSTSSSDLYFTTHRSGYDYLDYFSMTPSEIIKYEILSDYNGVIEPHVDMGITILNSIEGYSYEYKICVNSGNTATETCQAGAYYESNGILITDEYVRFECLPNVDTFTITVYEYPDSSSPETTRTATGSLRCMYVRREFRDLTTEDRDSLMDAMWVMWSTEEEDGKSSYGDNFHNYEYLLEFHYFNAAWQDADHIHEGNGFIAQHIKMDLIFEAALQAVDPSLTMPYWDYTIDRAYNLSVWESPLFTNETFGSLTLPSDKSMGWLYKNDDMDSAAIPDGRWKGFKAEDNTKYSKLQSGYGLMRAPWNMNPSQYITRFTSTSKELPACSTHYTMLGYTKLSDFLGKAPYSPHGAVHIAIGGNYGCDAMDDLREAGYIYDEEAQVNLCKNYIFYLKEFYRMNLISPKQNCVAENADGIFSTDYDDQHCGYICNPDNTEELKSCLKGGGSKPSGGPIDNIVNCVNGDLEDSILNTNDDCVPTIDEMPDAGWDAWYDSICEGDGYKVFGGDHLESASPADPSFWPIHPTLERLLQAKFMAGGFYTDDTWPSDASTEYVCGHHECFDPDNGGYGAWDTCCYGHFQYDQYIDFSVGLKTAYNGPTNDDIFTWTNPTTTAYAMEYIYDKFDWSHCDTELGGDYDFNELIETLYQGSQTSSSTTTSASNPTSSSTKTSSSSSSTASSSSSSSSFKHQSKDETYGGGRKK